LICADEVFIALVPGAHHDDELVELDGAVPVRVGLPDDRHDLRVGGVVAKRSGSVLEPVYFLINSKSDLSLGSML
jgi:hypothetical protein